jgi:hypothetical protein
VTRCETVACLKDLDPNLYLRFCTDSELAQELKRRKAFSFSDNLDEIVVEHCYSGFMGHPLVVFIWSKDGVLLNTVTKDTVGRLWVSNGSKAKVKTAEELTKAERVFAALRRFLLNVFEKL